MVSDMRAPRSSLCRLTAVCVAMAALMGQWPTAHAQVDLDSLEAAYIYNFTQFTEWPATQAGGTLAVCVNPHGQLGVTLAKLEGRIVSGKTWSVKPIPAGPGSRGSRAIIGDGAASSACLCILHHRRQLERSGKSLQKSVGVACRPKAVARGIDG